MTIFIRTLFAIAMLSIASASVALFWSIENKLPPISYNEFLTILEEDELAEVHLKGGEISVKNTFGYEFVTFSPDVPGLLPKLLEKNVIITGSSAQPSSLWKIAGLAVPVILILFVWYSMLRNQPEKEQSSDFTKDKVSRFTSQKNPVTFRDVSGVPEAKVELLEIIDFLQRPKKYSKLGAIIPRGVLFQGPPGTGKTLIARAVAGESGVPFFSISGSDFVEMFVGVGASRVRDLFKEAKKQAPCIIFIDEIDAVGGHRGAGGTSGGGQDERGQTLNALLVEMDGFSTDETVIVLAATNRPDILDPALLRPGRFDRQINILPPDIKGRLKILSIYGDKLKLAKDIDLEEVARSTPGFTGAELASLTNEAALIAGRMNENFIRDEHFEIAKDRILMGVERKGLVISKNDRKTMAYHEAGHAILAKFLPETDPIHKITIIPRGKALGSTQQLPLADRHAYPKEYILSRIKILMGGRIAEEICLNQQTTGAEDDFRQAVDLATKMVCQWGMTKAIGPMAHIIANESFLGEQSSYAAHSEETSKSIDREIKNIITTCYAEARELLTKEKDFLIYLADMLLVNETLDQEEMEIIYECTSKKRSQGTSAKSPGDGVAFSCDISHAIDDE